MLRYVIWFVAAGTGIAVTIIALTSLKYMWMDIFPTLYNFLGSRFFLALLLTLWPSGTLVIAVGERSLLSAYGLSMLALSFAVNAIFYGGIGALVWTGVHKNRWVLYLFCVVVAASVGYFWYWIYSI